HWPFPKANQPEGARRLFTAAITNDDNSIQLSSHRRVKLAQATASAELSLFFIPRQLDRTGLRICKRLGRWRAETGTEAVNMVVGMRVEHGRLARLGWVYDGFGGYRKKPAASSHRRRKLAASNVQVNGRFRPADQLSFFVFAGGLAAPGRAV